MTATTQASELEELVIRLIQQTKDAYQIIDGSQAESVCTRLRLRLVYITKSISHDGSFDPASHTIMVNLKRSSRNERRQFTIFHEIVHFLIDQDGAVIEYLTDAYRDDPEGYQAGLEHACDVGAAEFMAPRAQVIGYIDQRGLTADLIPYIRFHHRMSLSATMRQLAACVPYPSFLVWCRFSPSRLAVPPRDCLCVSPAAASRHVTYGLAQGTVIPDDHLFHEVWRHRQAMRAETYVPIRSGKRMPCWGEAQRIDNELFGILSWNR